MHDINVRPTSIKFLEEKLGGILDDIGIGNNFLDMTQKYRQQKKN